MDLTIEEIRTLRMALAVEMDTSEDRAVKYLPKSDATFEENQARAKWRSYYKERARAAHALLNKLHAELVARTNVAETL